jgi:GT2 family glycosyltransferase/predicted SAM-dependent methyltransferase
VSNVDILIPTWNNPQYIVPCLESLSQLIHIDMADIIVVNNGEKGSVTVQSPKVKVLDAGKNLGWEGGLKLGLEHSKAPFVCFLNDDTFFPFSESLWLNKLIQNFRDPKVVAVGPSSNAIMGVQNIWAKTNWPVVSVRFLIGLCFLVRRDALDACGGVDDTLPGGDDIDLSIRLRKNGGSLLCDKNAFVFHHYGKTGNRVHPGWDGIEHQTAYRKALWEKHGLKEFLLTMNHQVITGSPWEKVNSDLEGDMVRSFIQGKAVYDIGCGDTKTIPESIGLDIVPDGQPMGGVMGRHSHGDLVCNVFEDLPVNNADTIIARHVLEHTHDPLNALRVWKKSLKPHGGRLIIAVPDEAKGSMIPLNPEHKAAFTKDSLQRLAEAVGFQTIVIQDSENPISFVGVFERNGK